MRASAVPGISMSAQHGKEDHATASVTTQPGVHASQPKAALRASASEPETSKDDMKKSGSKWRAGARLGALLIALGALAVGASVAGVGADAGTASSAGQGPRVGPVAATATGAVRGT